MILPDSYSLYLVKPGVSIMASVQRCLFLVGIFGRTVKTMKIAVHNTFLDVLSTYMIAVQIKVFLDEIASLNSLLNGIYRIGGNPY